jgi:phenylalanyl-tRNA synthetase beta subunit
MIGLTLGVAVLITVLSVMNGFDRELKNRVLGMVPQATAPFDQTRSAKITADFGGEPVTIGTVGELKQQVVKNFKLPQYTSAFSLDIDNLLKVATGSQRLYTPLSRYPSTSRDVSIKSPDDVKFTTVSKLIDQVIAEVTSGITTENQLMTVYRPTDEKTKTTTFRLKFTSYDKTLSDKDIEPIMTKLTSAVEKSGFEIV